MTEKIRKPRKPKPPANPVPPPAPSAMPTGVPKGNVPAGNIAGGGPWALVTKWRPVTWREGAKHGVPWSWLESAMIVESGGRVDAADPHGAVGLMQVKPRYWSAEAARLGYDLATPEGQIGMAAAILGGGVPVTKGMTPEEAFLKVYYPTPGLDVPGESGHTPRQYLEDIALYRGILERAAGTTPAPAPEPTTPAPKPIDPLSAILGGRPVPAITYGWKADGGLDYYGYFVGHGGERSTQHPGVDLPLPCGTALHVPVAGVVDCVGNAGTPRWGQACGAYRDVDGGGVGNVTILLDPGTVKLTLGHCREAFVRPGQRVTAGQKVATVGSMNGCHVHVETSIRRADGQYQLVEPVAALRSVMGGGTTPDAPRPTLNVEIAIADGAGLNRPKTKLLPGDLWVTLHETANEDPGADARMHRNFVNTGGGAESVSFHFAVDDQRAVQILPLDEIAFHAGDRCDDTATDHGCFRSVAIEVCVNAPQGSSRWAKAKGNAAALIAGIVTTPEKFVGGKALAGRFSFDRVAPHRKWSGKNCPTRMLAEGSLPAVVAEARSIAAGGSGTTPAPAKRFPVAIPDRLVLELFPSADPNGIVTKAWMAKGCPPFDFKVLPEPGDPWTYWVFSTLILRSKDGTVEEVAA